MSVPSVTPVPMSRPVISAGVSDTIRKAVPRQSPQDMRNSTEYVVNNSVSLSVPHTLPTYEQAMGLPPQVSQSSQPIPQHIVHSQQPQFSQTIVHKSFPEGPGSEVAETVKSAYIVSQGHLSYKKPVSKVEFEQVDGSRNMVVKENGNTAANRTYVVRWGTELLPIFVTDGLGRLMVLDRSNPKKPIHRDVKVLDNDRKNQNSRIIGFKLDGQGSKGSTDKNDYVQIGTLDQVRDIVMGTYQKTRFGTNGGSQPYFFHTKDNPLLNCWERAVSPEKNVREAYRRENLVHKTTRRGQIIKKARNYTLMGIGGTGVILSIALPPAAVAGAIPASGAGGGGLSAVGAGFVGTLSGLAGAGLIGTGLWQNYKYKKSQKESKEAKEQPHILTRNSKIEDRVVAIAPNVVIGR